MDDQEKQLEFLRKHMMDLAETASEKYYAVTSDFLSAYEQDYIRNHVSASAYPSIEIRYEGGYELAERKIIEFIPVGVGTIDPAPICALYISASAKKFSEKLTHRDFLGSVMGLGFERSAIGDLIMLDDCSCALICLERMADYIAEELTTVSRTPVTVKRMETSEIAAISPNLKTVAGTIASERLDSIIALAFRISRQTAGDLIKGEKVAVNGRILTQSSSPVKTGAILSVRGYGKFIYDGASKVSKKDRLCVSVRIFQ